MKRKGIALTELMVALCASIGLASVLFPVYTMNTNDVLSNWGFAIIVIIVAGGALAVCFAAGWNPVRLLICLPFYFVMWFSITTLVLYTYSPRMIQCAETLLP